MPWQHCCNLPANLHVLVAENIKLRRLKRNEMGMGSEYDIKAPSFPSILDYLKPSASDVCCDDILIELHAETSAKFDVRQVDKNMGLLNQYTDKSPPAQMEVSALDAQS